MILNYNDYKEMKKNTLIEIRKIRQIMKEDGVSIELMDKMRFLEEKMDYLNDIQPYMEEIRALKRFKINILRGHGLA